MMFHQIIPNSKYLQISGDELSANIKLPSRAARASQAIEETLLGFICNICFIVVGNRLSQQPSESCKYLCLAFQYSGKNWKTKEYANIWTTDYCF